jgi:hypothetical protein
MQTLIRLIILSFCFVLCEQVHAFSELVQLTRTNIQDFRYIITVKSHPEKDGNTQFDVAVEFYQKEQSSACFYGTLQLMDGKGLIASSSVENARPRAPSKFFEPKKKNIPLVFRFTIASELLPYSKFTVVYLYDDNIGDTYWFYLRDFEDTKQPPIPLKRIQ